MSIEFSSRGPPLGDESAGYDRADGPGGPARAGLVGLMHCVALEGEEHGILVNALLPMSHSRLALEMSEEWARKVRLSPDIALVGSRGTAPYVAPLVLYLVSEQCNVTRHVYSALAGRYARAFVGVADGWMSMADLPPSVEDVHRHFTEIGASNSYYVPLSVADEFTPLFDRLRQTKK